MSIRVDDPGRAWSAAFVSCAMTLSVVGVSDALGAAIRVDGGAAPGGDGTSWPTAYVNLCEAIDSAAAGDEIWVAAGVYTPGPPGGGADPAFTFRLRPGIAVLGGFRGDEDSADERDWVVNPTVLSGDFNGDDGPDFAGTDENSRHVLDGTSGDAGTILDGFTVTGGHARIADGDDFGGGGLLVAGGDVTVRNCVFHRNNASAEGELGGGGGIYLREGDLTIVACVFEANRAEEHGGGIRVRDAGSVTITGSTLSDNVAEVGGGLEFHAGQHVTLRDCAFIGNLAIAGGGGAFCFEIDVQVVDGCEFRDNAAVTGPGGGLISSNSEGKSIMVSNTIFAENTAGALGGGWFVGGNASAVNCVYSRNVSRTSVGGGVFAAGAVAIVNCSFSRNAGVGLMVDRWEGAVATVENTILWGNVPEQIAPHPTGSGLLPLVAFSDVEGGWSGPGSNNIDVDPLFIQPGADDLHLAAASPCIDAGSNDAVPAGVETDLDGQPRIQEGLVDIGAYEGGAGEALPPSALAGDLDAGELATLIPGGAELDPMLHALAFVRNVDGPDDAMVLLTQYDAPAVPEAHRYTEQAVTLIMETDIPDGSIQSTIAIPFGPEDLEPGQDPLDLDLTVVDIGTGHWSLAVAANTVPSVGHAGAVGDRLARRTSSEGWTWSTQLGDYGVNWNPSTERGFVWAVVDTAGVFGAGDAICPADTLQPPNGRVGFEDLSYVLASWGTAGGPFDVTGDGVVDGLDVLSVFAHWGFCPGE